jgi:Fis family transcriptional regulator
MQKTESTKQPVESSLSASVTASLDAYFKSLEGEMPTDLHDLVIQQVEKPMIEFVLAKVDQNQSKAAKLLGINRNTLKKKMNQYQVKA